jgi:predicted metal-dependent HD superfamily phosphohydrolase
MCEELADHYNISADDKELLLVAAWFHDAGYSVAYDTHEQESAAIARDFLSKRQDPEDKISKVEALILSTNIKRKPSDLLEEMLHDADFINIGRKGFFTRAQALRIEWELKCKKKFTEKEWQELQLRFLIENNFYTKYCLKRYTERRSKNIEEQKKRIDTLNTELEKLKVKAQAKLKEKTVEDTQPKRGVETMFRSIYRNHISLSSIADSKANMMISINTIIMSVIISLVGSGFVIVKTTFEHYRFVIPLFILLATCLASVIFAVLSAQPNVTKKNPDRKDIKEKKSSLLFFGNFSSMPLADFITDVNLLMNNKEDLYDNMTVDIYYLGKVLTRKYQLIRISYAVFLIGLILCVTSFGVVMAMSYGYSSTQ